MSYNEVQFFNFASSKSSVTTNKVLLESDTFKNVLSLASCPDPRTFQSFQFESVQPGVSHEVERVANAVFAHFQVG